MTAAPATEPDVARIWDNFTALCALLAPGGPDPAQRWDTMDWEGIIRLAHSHKVGPAVWSGIARADGVPNSVKAFFHVLRDHNARRNSAMVDDLCAALSVLQAGGFEPVLLKGAASLADGLYNDPAERLMLDVDLLVEPEQADQCALALRDFGYQAFDQKSRWFRRKKHHLPPLRAPSGQFCIELHTSLLGRKFESLLPRADLMRRAREVQWGGHAVRLLAPTDRFVHNIVHSQLHHKLDAAGMVELRQLRELCYLVDRHRMAIDWSEVAQRFRRVGREAILAEQASYSRVLMSVSWPLQEGKSARSVDRLRSAVTRGPRRRRTIFRRLIETVRRLRLSCAA
jgi:hypothetical protein